MGLGTDTRGSVRIPAALCGLTGWKPTARRVPRDGAFPLSVTLDSVGPIARSVACCAAYDAVLSALNAASPTPTGSTTPPPQPGGTNRIVGAQSGRCIDVPNSSTTDGTRVQLYDCHGQSNQAWTYTSSKQLQVYGSKCLHANGSGNGSAVQISSCNGQSNQQWNVNTNGTITGVQSGRCLDVWSTANGAQVQIYDCNGQANQQFSLVPIGGSTTPPPTTTPPPGGNPYQRGPDPTLASVAATSPPGELM